MTVTINIKLNKDSDVKFIGGKFDTTKGFWNSTPDHGVFAIAIDGTQNTIKYTLTNNGNQAYWLNFTREDGTTIKIESMEVNSDGTSMEVVLDEEPKKINLINKNGTLVGSEVSHPGSHTINVNKDGTLSLSSEPISEKKEEKKDDSKKEDIALPVREKNKDIDDDKDDKDKEGRDEEIERLKKEIEDLEAKNKKMLENENKCSIEDNKDSDCYDKIADLDNIINQIKNKERNIKRDENQLRNMINRLTELRRRIAFYQNKYDALQDEINKMKDNVDEKKKDMSDLVERCSNNCKI